jgi:DNA-directed RNA polymerase specialized sigma24 family protein
LARHQRFERVFAEVYGPLQRYVRRRAGATVVEDVVADTLLVLWRRLDVVPADAQLAWCYGAARRCLANHRRADERRGCLATRVASQPTDADGEQADVVTLTAGTDVSVALDGVEFVDGQRYLVTVLNGEVQICGISAPATPELEALCDQWYGS